MHHKDLLMNRFHIHVGVKDPAGIAWETYHTMSDAEVFSKKAPAATSCCPPKSSTTKSCC